MNLAAAVLLSAAALDYARAREVPWLTLFFQDKSHAAVIAYCLAFLLLYVNRSVLRFALAALVFAASIATASRLVALGAPMLLVAGLVEYRRSRAYATTAAAVFAHHLVLLTIPIGFYRLWQSDLAEALTERLSYAGNSNDASLYAHFALINTAWDLKWSGLTQLVLGAGPGGFGPTAQAEGISLAGIARFDPGAIEAINAGFAPIHSTNVSMLVEFPIWFFAAFVTLWWKTISSILRQREFTLAMMALGLLTVTTFYSSHNEYFYTVLVSILCLAAFRSPDTEPPPEAHAQRSKVPAVRSG